MSYMESNYAEMMEREAFVPEHMRDGFRLWIEKGIPPGSFGVAVLSNDLKGAFGRADYINKNHVGSIVAWLYNFAPCDCWGSKEAVENWTKRRKEN